MKRYGCHVPTGRLQSNKPAESAIWQRMGHESSFRCLPVQEVVQPSTMHSMRGTMLHLASRSIPPAIQVSPIAAVSLLLLQELSSNETFLRRKFKYQAAAGHSAASWTALKLP